jgi:glutamate formiminotransferase / 5-formyltetrahydrofolate cyclo-ligase
VTLECVVNVSEGRDGRVVAGLAAAVGTGLLDVHSDAHHHRSVLTLGGPADAVEEAVRSLARATVATLDIRRHQGVHPRIGVLDVVPWVSVEGWPLADGPLAEAVAARDRFATWAGRELDLPCFIYGPERTLPDLRRGAWTDLSPAAGPARPHPTAGAVAVGARPILLAYNLWLAEADPTTALAAARQVAAAIRGPHVRALGVAVGTSAQVSCNLIAPWLVGPGAAFDAVASRVGVARAELVGLAPRAILAAEPRHRWPELDLDLSTTIEARLEQAGLDGGRFGTHQR